MIISTQIPGNTLCIEKPKSTWGEYRNAAIIRIEGRDFEQIVYYTIDSSKKRRRLFIRFMWWITNWLYKRYKPIQFYKCMMEIRLNEKELEQLRYFGRSNNATN